MNQPPASRNLAAITQRIYEQHGPQYDGERAKNLFEHQWLLRFANLLPERGTILDAGCGAGEPIAQYFIQQGHDLTGIDFATSMIALAKERFPHSEWLVADMRTLDLPRTFDGIIGWHSFFHLTPGEQRTTLQHFARHLRPQGVLMLTVGPQEGEVVGHVAGQPVYHSSLSPSAYRAVLEHLGLTIIDFVTEDPECGFATILLAQKIEYIDNSLPLP